MPKIKKSNSNYIPPVRQTISSERRREIGKSNRFKNSYEGKLQHLFERRQNSLLNLNRSRSTSSFHHPAQFYERYEPFAKYDNIVSQLKLATVSYGYRPRTWGEDKTIKEIENVFSYLSEWKEMARKSNSPMAINIEHDHNFLGNLLISCYNDKYQTTKILQEKEKVSFKAKKKQLIIKMGHL